MNPSISFENKGIRLRALEPVDIDLLYSWENDPNIWKLSNTLTPFSRYSIEQFVKNAQADIYQSRQVRWMIDLTSKDKTETIGTIDLFEFDPLHRRAGIGILIQDSNNREKGYANSALEVIVEYSFRILELHQLYCNISEKNISSLALFRKQGFKVVGEKKEWIYENEEWQSEFLLQLLRNDYLLMIND